MKEKVNILLTGTLPTFLGSRNYGGVAKVVWAQAKAIQAKQADFAVLGLGKYFGGQKTYEGVPIFGVGINVGALIKTLKTVFTHKGAFQGMDNKDRMRLVFAFYALHYISSRITFECIHVHHVYNQIPLASKLLFPDLPVLATIHSYHEIIMESSPKRQAGIITNYIRQMGILDAITHVSRAVRDQGRALGIQWACPDHVVYNGTNFPLEKIEAFDSVARKPGTLSFSGALIDRKGVWKLLDAVKRLRPEISKLTMTGTGVLREEILDFAAHNEIPLDLKGYLQEHEEVFEIMASSSVFVLPSISETFGLVYIESVLSGTPAVGYHAVMYEFHKLFGLEGDICDWLIPFDHENETPDQLAEKIKRGLQVKSRPNYIEERDFLRNKIVAHFSWGSISEAYLQIYTGLGPNTRQ